MHGHALISNLTETDLRCTFWITKINNVSSENLEGVLLELQGLLFEFWLNQRLKLITVELTGPCLVSLEFHLTRLDWSRCN